MMLEFCSGGALDDLILGKLAFAQVLLCSKLAQKCRENNQKVFETLKIFCLCIKRLLITLLYIRFETFTEILVMSG